MILLLQTRRGLFSDESENLALGALWTEGISPYRDVFTHHFPFAYAWVGAIVGVFSRSIGTVRAMTVMLVLIGLAASGWLIRRPVTIATVALAWSLLAPLYGGQMVVAYSIKAAGLMPPFLITLGTLISDVAIGPAAGAWFVLGALIAILTEPTSVYPVALALGALIVAGQGARKVILLGASIAGGVFLTVVALWVWGLLANFVHSTIHYNVTAYATFGRPGRGAFEMVLPLRGFAQQLTTGLGLLDPRWQALATPESVWRGSLFDDHWLFAGMLYRWAVLTFVVHLALERRRAASAFVYVWCAALLATRGEYGFHAAPFVLTSLACMALTLSDAVGGRRSPARLLVGVAPAIAMIWPLGLGGLALSRDLPEIMREPAWSEHERESARVLELGCGRPELRFSSYPFDLYINFLIGVPPVTRHPYLLPWLPSEAFHDAARAAVEGETIVRIDRSAVFGPFRSATFLAPLATTVEARMLMTEDRFYVSPSLAAYCGAAAIAQASSQFR